ncbi:MAG: GNAT family N-acetyltransferase [Flavobacteriaceae bacterium]|nr:GNAT family N-acetyltransferase [Flavobacteriaceae bacterium]
MDSIIISKKTNNLKELYPLLLLADPDKEKIDSYLTKSDCFVLELNMKIIGVLVLQKLNEASSEIMNVAILEKYQNKGFGEKLIKYVVNQSKNEKEYRFVICTGNSSISQLLLYQKLGFTIFDIKYNYFTKNYRTPIFENGILCSHKICLELFK